MKKKAPKLFRRKKAGKYVGNYFVTIGDVPINLGTKDAGLALGRREHALRGKRNFADDAETAADDTTRALAPMPSPLESVTPPPAGDVPPAPAPVTPAPAVVPDEIIPPPPGGSPGSPPPPPTEGWADAAAAAADEAADDDTEEEPGKPPPTFHVTIEDIAKLLKLPADELAPLLVEIQIRSGELVANALDGEVAPVPADDVGRTILTAGYVPVVRLLQAEDLKIHPGWFILAGSLSIAATQWRTFQKRAKPAKPAGA